MGNLMIFEKPEFGKIRTLEIDGKPYFVAVDIAKALGYKKPENAIERHCRYTLKQGVPHPQSKNKQLLVNVIPEGDLYRLITHSELQEAEKFEAWVFDDVLPSIRRHGMYAIDELLENPDLLIQAATALKEEKQRRIVAERRTNELQAELDYSKEWYSIKRVAAINGVSWRDFEWKKLKDHGTAMGYPPKKIFDANYGEVNTYHRSVWETVYPNYEI